MRVGTALKQGFSIARRVRSAAWVLLLVNLGLAALAALPIYRGVLRFTGQRLMESELAHGFPLEWLSDFYVNSPGSLDRYAGVILLIGLLSIPVNAILTGGVLAQFRQPDQGFWIADFYRDTKRYAWRLIRLMIVGLICYWLIFRLLHQGLGGLVDKWTDNWPSDRAVFWVELAAGILVLVGLVLVNLIMDYARVKLVMEENTSALGAFIGASGFCFGRLGKALVVYAVPAVCGIALLGVYRLVVPWSDIHQPLTVALLFIGQQVIMFGRFWFRVATWASEWSYYGGSRASRGESM